MEISEIKAVSEFAMKYESLRMQTAATNIAFANHMSGSPATAFKPLVINIDGVDRLNNEILNLESFVKTIQKNLQVNVLATGSVKPVHLPDSPLADTAGYVYKPDVNLVNEMLTLNTATRAYEANIRAFNTASEMSRKALQIGKQQ